MDRILIAHPDEQKSGLIRQRIETVLVAEVCETGSVRNAIELISSESFRLVISALKYPYRNGLQIFWHLEDSGFGETTFIMLDEFEQLSNNESETMIMLKGEGVESLIDDLLFLGLESRNQSER